MTRECSHASSNGFHIHHFTPHSATEILLPAKRILFSCCISTLIYVFAVRTHTALKNAQHTFRIDALYKVWKMSKWICGLDPFRKKYRFDSRIKDSICPKEMIDKTYKRIHDAAYFYVRIIFLMRMISFNAYNSMEFATFFVVLV